jgi:3-isopropylmalate/(R)-2-methylmalate dehydratase small subunit
MPGDISPLCGFAHTVGDQITADDIIPPRRKHIYPNTEMALFTFEEKKPEFAHRVKTNDILAAGENFGAYTTDEAPVNALRVSGIAVTLAASFAPEFINYAKYNGIVLMQTAETGAISDGDSLEIDFDLNEIRNLTKGETYNAVRL